MIVASGAAVVVPKILARWALSEVEQRGPVVAEGKFIHANPSDPIHWGKGSVSVIDFATRQVVATWIIPGGGSPDMGNVSVDGRVLWLSGRFDNVVYAIDTGSGEVRSIPVGKEPHGLTVWPQPGRYSLGHTGNMR